MKKLLRAALWLLPWALLAANVLEMSGGRQTEETAEEVGVFSAPTPADRREPDSVLYVVSVFGGRVAVYSPAALSVPKEITPIEEALLPGVDRLELRRGIGVDSERALSMLLEDLGS